MRSRKRRVCPDFLAALITSSYGRNYFTATSVQSTNLACTNSSKLKDFSLPLPEIREQQAIVDRLHSMREKSDQSVRLLSSTIDRLREYRAALITAAVTGQLDLKKHEKQMEALV